jgi:hypothetical protein
LGLRTVDDPGAGAGWLGAALAGGAVAALALRGLDRAFFGDRRLPSRWLYALVFLAIGSVPFWGGLLSDLGAVVFVGVVGGFLIAAFLQTGRDRAKTRFRGPGADGIP